VNKIIQICVASGTQDYDDVLYALSEDGKIYRTPANTVNWKQIESPEEVENALKNIKSLDA
jgi:hypothetical protein